MPAHLRLLTAAPLLLMGAVVASCSGEDGVGSAGDCASAVEVDGRLYLGHGEVRRDPRTTGRTVDAVLPPCNDTGGQAADEPAQHVQVEELVDVPVERAVLWNGGVYLRQGSPVPEAARAWFRAPRCADAGTFPLRGEWLAVGGAQPHQDGELRPPYRVVVHVTDGPAAYVGTTLRVLATRATDPLLGPDDVRTSLWQGGDVAARVRCDDGAFTALSLAVPQGG